MQLSSTQHIPVNNNDFYAVDILFTNLDISKLFLKLLNANGLNANLINSLQEFTSTKKLVTELQFYDKLSTELKAHCLVLTPQEKIPNSGGIILQQPLTEKKVEDALRQLIKTTF